MKRAGTLTCSLMLIAIGVLSILTQTNRLFITEKQSIIIAAAFFVILGIELILSKNKNSYINFPYILFTIIILIIAFGMNYNIRYDLGQLNNISRAQMNIKSNVTRTIDSNGIKSLNLTNNYGNININASQSGDIRIKAVVYSKSKINTGDVVNINKNAENLNIESRKIKDTSVDYEIYLPDNVDVTVDDSFGDVALSGIKTDNINIHDSFGNINTDNVVSNLDITDNHGEVTLDSVKRNTEVNSSYGSIKVNYDMPDYDSLDKINLSDNFGDISVTGLKYDNCRVKADTSFGDIKSADISNSSDNNKLDKHVSFQNGNGNLHITAVSKFGDVSLY